MEMGVEFIDEHGGGPGVRLALAAQLKRGQGNLEKT
jgi:hypothetical protein